MAFLIKITLENYDISCALCCAPTKYDTVSPSLLFKCSRPCWKNIESRLNSYVDSILDLDSSFPSEAGKMVKIKTFVLTSTIDVLSWIYCLLFVEIAATTFVYSALMIVLKHCILLLLWQLLSYRFSSFGERCIHLKNCFQMNQVVMLFLIYLADAPAYYFEQFAFFLGADVYSQIIPNEVRRYTHGSLIA